MRLNRRREIIGITDWLAAEARHHGADLRLNSYLETDDILAGAPDVVVIATGGTPNTSFLEGGQDLVTTSWDVLGGQILVREAGGVTNAFGAHGITQKDYSIACGPALAAELHAAAKV